MIDEWIFGNVYNNSMEKFGNSLEMVTWVLDVKAIMYEE